MGKGEIAHNEQFLLFRQCFQKACFPEVSKGVIVWEWVNSYWNGPEPFNPLRNKPLYFSVCRTSLLKTLWEKEKLLVKSYFSFFHNVFYPFGELPAIFIKSEIVVCKLFHFGSVENFLFWKGFNAQSSFLIRTCAAVQSWIYIVCSLNLGRF